MNLEDPSARRWQRLPTTWRRMAEENGSEPLSQGVMSQGVLALIEAARAEPELRRLYPYTSHFTLWFSASEGHPFAVTAPAVEPLPDGRFRVRGPRQTTTLGETDTATAAIALVVANLPGN
ncbi:DUF6193 family natural product biosynthesis protein [Streptomyces sp. NBC_00503]|uniref:DUF6193 family natural product biosynthesis protein n=1 Tax=Streptomyces sp. NBC_00503 TaxID=2903659 RepID=UPI002E807A91|nr:DUF6193 family natural product biosynthesis protein [Streptomyces sp. NBC_00503]WUD81142.1 DUF6193 family natural product biosynthesis protein [Streptomyces sp. NBC_00503]